MLFMNVKCFITFEYDKLSKSYQEINFLTHMKNTCFIKIIEWLVK